MGLTGLQIFKLLPKTNCKECNYPTCLAFAMKLAAGKEKLEKCPYASDEAKAALGAASAPPIRGVTIGSGERAVTVGEETVFFRHEKTFVRPAGLFQVADAKTDLDALASLRIERAGETFRVDGVAVTESSGEVAKAAAERGLPVVALAETPEGARKILEPLKASRPLLVPPRGADPVPYVALAKELGVPVVVSGPTLDQTAEAAVKAGMEDVLLEPPGENLKELHENLTRIRRGALDRANPGFAFPVFLRVGPGEFEKASLGIAKFASLITLTDAGGESWLPLWTLRQNIYTDPQKPLRMDPGIYPVGEPDAKSPLLVTTNFSLTYFTVSTEAEGTGTACHMAVVDTEGMSVLTAWAAGKFSGEGVGKALKALGALEKVDHKTAIIPGYAAPISGELEDALGDGWKVLTGPQEASDLGAFLRDIWSSAQKG